MDKDLRAFAAGLVIFAGLAATYFAMVTWSPESTRLSATLARVVIYSAPLLAGAMCALLRPRHPFGTMFLLGVGAAACFTGLDFAFNRFGHPVDLGGMSPLTWVAGISLMTMPLLVFVGGFLGMLLAHRVAQ